MSNEIVARWSSDARPEDANRKTTGKRPEGHSTRPNVRNFSTHACTASFAAPFKEDEVFLMQILYTNHVPNSAAARHLLPARNFRERLRVGCDGLGDGSAVDELPFAVADDQAGFAQNFQMMRDGCGGHAAHRHNLAAVHLIGGRDLLKDPEAGLVGQGFRYLFNFRAVHRST